MISGTSVALVGVFPQSLQQGVDPLEELENLARAAGLCPVARCLQRQPTPHPQTYVGTGKVLELQRIAADAGAKLLLTDDDLNPAQARNLEKRTGLPAVDRSELILGIFAQRARTREARDQIELARLEYLLPRLRGMWAHLEKFKGGIGMRGPGEKQIETDRRLADRRIQFLRERTRRTLAHRDRQTAGRGGEFTVAIVGYTNAGKSTLMNRLSGAGVEADNRLFSTLDTRTRKIRLPAGGVALLSDTVGFLRKLPHHLVASFRATLAEARQADLLLHVVDASAENPTQQIEACEEVLDSLGCAGSPTILIANKMDLPTGARALAWLRARPKPCIAISARTGLGIHDLVTAIERQAQDRERTLRISCSADNGPLLAALRRRGRVLSTALAEKNRYRVTARIDPVSWRCIRPIGRGTIRTRWLD